MDSNPSRFSGCDDCPVETVRWYETVDPRNELYDLEGLDPGCEVHGIGCAPKIWFSPLLALCLEDCGLLERRLDG